MGKNKNVSALGQAINDFASIMTAASEYKKATTATSTEVQAEVKNRMKVFEDANNRVDIIESALKGAGKSDAEVAAILNAANLTKIDLTERQEIVSAEVQVELDGKKSAEFNNSIGEMMGLVGMMQAMSAEMNAMYAPQQVQPQPPTVVVVPQEPSIPQVAATPAPQQTQWEKHCSVTYDARSERFKVEQMFKNGEIDFPTYIKLKASINMQAFANHADVTAKKNRR